MLTAPQRLAILSLAGEEVPDWYDTPHLSTLKALEARGLVHWHIWTRNNEVGPRPYWVTPKDGYLDHHGPALTPEGEAVAQELVHA